MGLRGCREGKMGNMGWRELKLEKRRCSLKNTFHFKREVVLITQMVLTKAMLGH